MDDCDSPIYQAVRREASEDQSTVNLQSSTLQQQSTVKGEELVQVQPAEMEKEMIDQGQQHTQNTLITQHQNEETQSTN